MLADTFHVARRASLADIVCLAREALAVRRMPRTTEPTMAMEDLEQTLAYSQVGNAGGGMTAHYWLHALLAVRSLGQCRRVIDLACGPAIQLGMVARLMPECEFIGVDLSQEMLARAKANMQAMGVRNVRFVHADVTRIPLPDHYADGLMSTVALHHLPDLACVQAAIAEGWRVAGPQAACYIVDLLRPRNAANVPFLSRRDHPGAPAAFIADFEHSWRAAFTLADWRSVFRTRPLVGLRVTRPATLFMIAATPMVPVVRFALAGIGNPMAQLDAAARRTFDDLRAMFGLGGLSWLVNPQVSPAADAPAAGADSSAARPVARTVA